MAFSQTFSLTHDNVKREFLVHVPTSYNGTDSVPLIVALHGAGQSISSLESQSGLSKKSESAGFIVVYPKGILNNAWNQDITGADDIGFISDMLDSLSGRFKIDKNRVYVTGFSIGGGMCYRLAQELSNRITAIAPVSPWVGNTGVPTWIDYDLLNYSIPKRAIPIIQFNSKDDDYSKVSPEIGYWVSIDGCPAKPDTFLKTAKVIGEIWKSQSNKTEIKLYSAASGGHNWPTLDAFGYSATDTIWAFFKNYSRAQSAPFKDIVKIIAPKNGSIFDSPANIKIQVDTIVSSGKIAKVEFYQNNTKIGEDVTYPYEVEWSNVDKVSTYKIMVKALDSEGNLISPIQPVSIRIKQAIAINTPNSNPNKFELFQNSPNPAKNYTKITYSLQKPTFVNLCIFNLRGQLIKSLVNSFHPSGQFSVDWNLLDEHKNVIFPGVYVCKISTPEFQTQMKIVKN
jgi:polyhydroxybutyrate depolymerase